MNVLLSSMVLAVSTLVMALGDPPAASGEPPSAKGPDPGPETRVIERRPEGGLAYHVTMPADAGAAKPARLVVWLHPTGGLYNDHAEALAPAFVRHGFALMVILDKDARGWTFDDAKMLLGTTLPDAGAIEGIDLRSPLLLGFSAGGQVALELWRTKPSLYGGIVVDAAYPAETKDGKDVLHGPPSDPAIRDVPLLVFVGERDRLLWVWEKVRQPWIDAGVPLTVVVVPGKGHEWLFGDAQVEALEGWLDRLPAPRE